MSQGVKTAAAEAAGESKRRRTEGPEVANADEDEAPLLAPKPSDAPETPGPEPEDSSSEEEAPAVAKFLAASDAESSAPEAEKEAEKEAPATAPPVAAEASEASSDSDSESEASSSSSSDSESAAEEPGEAPPEDEEARRQRELQALQALRGAHLRRDELTGMLLDLPEAEAENAVLRAFVRLTMQARRQDSCVLAEVVGVERAAPYTVPLKSSRGLDNRSISLQLRCKRGASTRLVKVSSVSNQDVTEAEFEQWKKLTERTGVDASYYVEQMKQKARDIDAARRFVFDEASVSRQLKRKPGLEFDAQKESRMRFLVQCAHSQMDISGIRDVEAEELEASHKQAVEGLHRESQQSTRTQEAWFEKRPNLFSLKVINQKNLDRQIRDDRHALHYALENEASGSAAMNPFQRRPCRPVQAWDTQLTRLEAEAEAAAPAPARAEEAPAPPPPEQLQAPAAAAAEPQSRVARVMQAHRKANLLGRIVPTRAAQAA